jgi:hypothetical protein
VSIVGSRAGEADERRIGHGVAQVAAEAVGHLAGLIIHLAAKPTLAAVRFIRGEDALSSVCLSQFNFIGLKPSLLQQRVPHLCWGGGKGDQR